MFLAFLFFFFFFFGEGDHNTNGLIFSFLKFEVQNIKHGLNIENGIVKLTQSKPFI